LAHGSWMLQSRAAGQTHPSRARRLSRFLRSCDPRDLERARAKQLSKSILHPPSKRPDELLLRAKVRDRTDITRTGRGGGRSPYSSAHSSARAGYCFAAGELVST
jgi:hypothetical protein